MVSLLSQPCTVLRTCKLLPGILVLNQLLLLPPHGRKHLVHALLVYGLVHADAALVAVLSRVMRLSGSGLRPRCPCLRPGERRHVLLPVSLLQLEDNFQWRRLHIETLPLVAPTIIHWALRFPSLRGRD